MVQHLTDEPEDQQLKVTNVDRERAAHIMRTARAFEPLVPLTQEQRVQQLEEFLRVRKAGP